MQFPRHICNMHPTETITNFCEQESCLLPLCPSCIPIHLSNHPKCPSNNAGGNPRIQNIHSTFSKTLKSLCNYQQEFSDKKEQIKNLQAQHSSLKYALEEGLNNLKKDIKVLIDQWFEEVRLKYEQEIEELLRKNDKSQFRLEMFEEEVDEKLRDLTERIQCFKNSHQFDIKLMVDSINSDRNKHYTSHLELVKEEIQQHKQVQQKLKWNKQKTGAFQKIPKQFVKLLQYHISLDKHPDQPKSNQQVITYHELKDKSDSIKEQNVQLGVQSGKSTNNSFNSQQEPITKAQDIEKSIINNLKYYKKQSLKQNYNNLPYQIKQKFAIEPDRTKTYDGNQYEIKEVNHDLFYQQITGNHKNNQNRLNMLPSHQIYQRYY